MPVRLAEHMTIRSSSKTLIRPNEGNEPRLARLQHNYRTLILSNNHRLFSHLCRIRPKMAAGLSSVISRRPPSLTLMSQAKQNTPAPTPQKATSCLNQKLHFKRSNPIAPYCAVFVSLSSHAFGICCMQKASHKNQKTKIQCQRNKISGKYNSCRIFKKSYRAHYRLHPHLQPCWPCALSQ
jgi:hypothetical protein